MDQRGTVRAGDYIFPMENNENHQFGTAFSVKHRRVQQLQG